MKKLSEVLIQKNSYLKQEILDGLDKTLLKLHNVVFEFSNGDTDGVIQLEENKITIPETDNTDEECIKTITGIHMNNKIVWIERNGYDYEEEFDALDNDTLISLIQALEK